MRQTLFYLPHSIGPLPMFGLVSWSVIGLLIYIGTLILLSRKHGNIQDVFREGVVNWGIGAVIFGLLLPAMETRIPTDAGMEMVVGVPVRGYGVMMMLGVACAVWVAKRRTGQIGVTIDAFMALALWTVVSGLIGARLFYIVQKWNELGGDNLMSKLWVAFQFTEGGLVVYGSAIGGLIGILIWTYRNRIPPIPLIDAIVPAFFIGLAFGRVGCLLNGCCYGGICESDLPTIAFPRGAPAYVDQLHRGSLLGIHTTGDSDQNARIERVDPKSWAEGHSIRQGQSMNSLEFHTLPPRSISDMLALPELEGSVEIDRKVVRLPPEDFPRTSLRVHPAQIYASISAFLLFLWSSSIPNWHLRSGLVFGSGLIAYGILRVLEEIIRVDEAGQFGTQLSIAQWISLLGIISGIILITMAFRRSSRVATPTIAH
ncbi:MAG: prolipoprotein diacylglyceryl transferase [Planctomycetes bacterium]|nr:prolipoprotein diacylglyceryl transferase [Planctomycetota bacterium]